MIRTDIVRGESARVRPFLCVTGSRSKSAVGLNGGVEEVVDFAGAGAADQGGEFFGAGSPDLGDGAEMLQQLADRLPAYARNLFQLAVDECLAALLAVERDSEAVDLLLDVRQQVEDRRGGTQAD